MKARRALRQAGAAVAALFVASGAVIGDRSPVGPRHPVSRWPLTFYPFRAFAPSPEPNARRERLCDEAADPDGAPDKVRIHCALEGGSFASVPAAPRDRLVVMAYNLERGIHAGAQIETLRDDPALPRPDLLLLSEADRGCSRSGYRNVARDFARALAMDYVFGVEFLELPRESGGGGRIETVCEHGNAILSRYPLGNVRLLRHARNRSWYLGPRKRAAGGGQPRLGGRMALFADVRVGARLLHAYSVHLESGIRDGEIRRDQARELALDSARLPFPVVIGGDTNAHGYLADLLFGTANDEASRTLLDGRYSDAHRSLPPLERATCPPFLVLDLLFGNGGLFSQPGVCPFSRCGRLSDHLPVWATLNLRTSRVWRKEGT